MSMGTHSGVVNLDPTFVQKQFETGTRIDAEVIFAIGANFQVHLKFFL
jgi:hypothetical protein